MGAPEAHPTAERAAAALEAAGLNPYILLHAKVAPTQYAEVRIGLARNAFSLRTLEELPVPALGADHQAALVAAALDLAQRWGLVWRGDVHDGRVDISFSGWVRYGPRDEPDEAGLRLHESILSLHHAHQALRQRCLNAAWRSAPPAAPSPVVA